MTLLLAHPTDEDLGRFVEGTLDDTERAAIVAHVADCDECRILVVDSAQFIEPAKRESRKWWLEVAASILIMAGGASFWYETRDPLTPVIKDSARLSRRLVEPRLGRFPYVARNTMRGSGDDIETAVYVLEGDVAEVLERKGNAPKIVHARGIAHLLTAATAKPEDQIEIAAQRRDAIASLVAAANREPNNARYQNDVAAALLTIGDSKNRDLAISYLDKALAIDQQNPEALFNRALAFRDRDPKEAIAAFKRYLAVDSTSPWADEAKRNLEYLQQSP
jgi:tetratricopeptide (TPR) repeat protein